MKNKHLVSATGKEIIVLIIVSLAVFITTFIIMINGCFPSFDNNLILKLTCYSIIAFLFLASAVTSIVAITIFVMGLVENINKEHKKNASK